MSKQNEVFWRFWDIQDGQLVSPFARDILPPTGLAESRSGICYWPTIEDIHKAIDVFLLRDGQHAITFGEVSGLRGADRHQQVYRVNGWMHRLPTSYRAQRYQVSTIYTDVKVTYDLPTHRLSELPTC